MRALVLTLLLALPARAGTEADLELVLAVDVARSMSPAELMVRREGHAAAPASPAGIGAIGAEPLGRIALTCAEGSGSGWQRVVADRTLIETAADAQRVADTIPFGAGGTLRRISIPEGLLFARDRLAANPFTAPRQVIDIPGDGPNNEGPPVTAARDAVVAAGITIDGLPLMRRDAPGEAWSIDRLDLSCCDGVIGGPGAFVVPVATRDAFPEAVRRKLVLAIAGLAVQGLRPAEAGDGRATDCPIGGRIRQPSRGFGMPWARRCRGAGPLTSHARLS
ncbi:MAG: DUF1194 domain-containing protein [Rhodobacteraceae bacterium]|nr:DUF1194 domain-containing protein [Paracoccaceae bacterium]